MGNPMINTNKAREFTGFASKNERLRQRIAARLESIAMALEDNPKLMPYAHVIHESVSDMMELELKP